MRGKKKAIRTMFPKYFEFDDGTKCVPLLQLQNVDLQKKSSNKFEARCDKVWWPNNVNLGQKVIQHPS